MQKRPGGGFGCRIGQRKVKKRKSVEEFRKHLLQLRQTRINMDQAAIAAELGKALLRGDVPKAYSWQRFDQLDGKRIRNRQLFKQSPGPQDYFKGIQHARAPAIVMKTGFKSKRQIYDPPYEEGTSQLKFPSFGRGARATSFG